jgi:hypothetical protein
MIFEDLKSSIGTWLDVDLNRLPNESRGQIINICQRELLRTYDLRFGEVTADIALSDGLAFYTLPSGWSRPYSLWYYSSGKQNVDYLTKEEFDIKYPLATVEGAPLHYTVWGNSIFFGPTPNASYTVKANYFKILADLTDGSPGNTNAFVEQAWEVIFFRSLWYASEFMLEDSRAQLWAAKAQMLEAKLAIEHARARSSGRRPVTREAGYVGGPAATQG